MKRYIKCTAFYNGTGNINLNRWIMDNENNPYDKILIYSDEPYEDTSDDCPGILFIGSYDELVNGKGDNSMVDFWRDVSKSEIQDDYFHWCVKEEYDDPDGTHNINVVWK